jgi:hypothetical protein
MSTFLIQLMSETKKSMDYLRSLTHLYPLTRHRTGFYLAEANLIILAGA